VDCPLRVFRPGPLGTPPGALPGAAFANGCAANGLDTDDGARYAHGHANAQIFPTFLAVAEAEAAAAAHLMGLKEEQIKNALGIAEYHAPKPSDHNGRGAVQPWHGPSQLCSCTGKSGRPRCSKKVYKLRNPGA
jgi:hypothetical protein